MARQLTFDLPHREVQGRGDFFVSDSNAPALAAIDGWQDWPNRKLVITGPEGAGKSHLVAIWAAVAKAMVVDAARVATLDMTELAGKNVALEDAEALAGDPEAERAAFHLHNLVLAEGGTLLVTARNAPTRWPLTLPDLASRMQGTSVVPLAPPDEALLAAVLVKLFADRQIAAPPNLIDYLVPRIERSLKAAKAVVAEIDALALAEGRAVTRAIGIRVLETQADLF